MMKSSELRKHFLKFFKEHGHRVVPSSPVIPHNDPTLLFVNAGMNQFKDVFLGKTSLEYTRATSSQKSIRVGGKHNDLDNVGHTTRHLTFFEMLGNFSFGDYFKKDAISMAWNFTTDVLKLPVDKLWVSIYHEDDEAFELWKEHIKENRIVRIAGKDNFWEMGDTGPCGPCTELFYDKGSKYGNARNPLEDSQSGERFFEFWNLVFMQFNRLESGVTSPLPKQSVDTGMGLERMASLLQGVETVFQTDILRAIIGKIERLSGIKYETNTAPFHVIADHIRSLSFCIADGAQPSNVDRGYVLRKILRRAVRYGRKLSFDTPFLAKLLPTLIDEMGDDYPELRSSQEKITEILTVEEENFFRTLKRGGNILHTIIEKSEKTALREISGDDAFKLKDTYGFPLEEILLLAKDSNLSVNLESYSLLEERAREMSKQSRKDHKQIAEESLFVEFVKKHPATNFVGYHHLDTNGSVIGILVDGEFQENLKEGQEGLIILDKTSFYAEKGGQIGDIGSISHHTAHFTVTNCTNPYPGVIVHEGKMDKGIFCIGEPVHTLVKGDRRQMICEGHTGAHLLNWALTKVLGTHVRQAGSFVGPGIIRFDFSHHKALTKEEIRKVELLIGAAIAENHPVTTYETSYEEVKNHSDIKQFFGDKYGATVRVVDIDGFSKELCGGTHASSTGELYRLRITKESSIAAGVRRIEAVTGEEADKFSYEKEDLLHSICESLQTSEGQVHDKISSLFAEMATLKGDLKAMRKIHVKALLDDLLTKKETIKHVHLIAAKASLLKDEVNPFMSDLFTHMKSGVVILGIEENNQASLIIKVSPDLVSQGIKANDLINEIAVEIGGTGGGKADMARAGGKEIHGLEAAFKKAHKILLNHA